MKIKELFTEASRTGQEISLEEIKDHKELAKKLGISVSKLKGLSDKELQSILQNLGFHDFTPNSKFNKHQLEKGVKIEREHTNSDLVAILIAKDHVSEDPKYYDKLEKIEND
jgi:hypothetical protein